MGKKCKNCGWDGNQPDWKLCGRCGLDPDVASQQPAAKSEQPPQLQDKPILTLDRSYIDCGSLVPGTTLSKTFTIRNAGRGILVGKITSDERWIGIFPDIVNLREPEEGIQVTIDTSLIPLNFRGSGYIDIQTNGGNARIEVKVNVQPSMVTSKRGWTAAGIVLLSISLISTAFMIIMAAISAGDPTFDIGSLVFGTIALIAPFVVPGVICLRHGLRLPPQMVLKDAKSPFHFWLLPILFGFFGGVASWVTQKRINRRQSLNMLTLGIIISVSWPFLAYSASLAWWYSIPSGELYYEPQQITFENAKLDSDHAAIEMLTFTNTGQRPIKCLLISDKDWLQITPTQIEVKSTTTIAEVRVSTIGLINDFKDTAHITVRTVGGEKRIPVYLTISSIIFEDDFSDLSSGWPVGSETDVKSEYLDGKYRMLNKAGDSYRWGQNDEIGQLDDFILEVDARWRGTPSIYNYYGIVFRVQDNDNKYVLYLPNNNGYYGLIKSVKGTDSELKSLTESTYINKGTTVNRIKVVCQGSKISVYANDSLLATVYDDSLLKGDVGLMAGKGKSTSSWITVPDADALFDNLKISAP